MAKLNDPDAPVLRVKVGGRKDYFFWNDKPYKKLSQSKRKNTLLAYDIESGKRVVLHYNNWNANHKKAYSTQEAARILNRHWTKLYKWIRDGKIPAPYWIPPAKGKENESVLQRGSHYLWQEKDFRNAVEFMESTGVWVDSTPNWAEVSAHLNEDEVIRYVQDDNGNFIPLWRAD